MFLKQFDEIKIRFRYFNFVKFNFMKRDKKRSLLFHKVWWVVGLVYNFTEICGQIELIECSSTDIYFLNNYCCEILNRYTN